MSTQLQKKLEQYLADTGISVAALEKKVGLNVRAIRNILKNRSKLPNESTLQTLSALLECSVEELISDQMELPLGQRGTPYEGLHLLQNAIKFYLKKTGLSIAALERLAGLHTSAVRNILNKQNTTPAISTLQTLAQFMGCSVEDLLEGKTENFKAPPLESSIKEVEEISASLQTGLAHYLNETNMSIAALERKAGLKISAVRSILSGKSQRPLADTIYALANVMGCTVQDLLEGKIGSRLESAGEAPRPSPVMTHPEIMRESLAHIFKTIQENNHPLTIWQALQILDEAYFFALKKEPPQTDFKFIEWLVRKVAS